MSRLVLEEIDLGFSRLPIGFDGFRILQISDLHMVREPGDRERLIARRVSEVQPDMLVLTGDLANRPRAQASVSTWLASLRNPDLRYAVPGNWDYKWHADSRAFEETMRDAGFTALCNRSARVERRGSTIQLVGIDDVNAGCPDPAKAFRDVDRDDFVIALCHNPDILLDPAASRFDLMLSGHTHGGQIRLPLFGAVITSTRLWKRFEAGLYEVGREQFVYVSRGVGTGGLNIRVLCPPELAVLTLRHGVS